VRVARVQAGNTTKEFFLGTRGPTQTSQPTPTPPPPPRRPGDPPSPTPRPPHGPHGYSRGVFRGGNTHRPLGTGACWRTRPGGPVRGPGGGGGTVVEGGGFPASTTGRPSRGGRASKAATKQGICAGRFLRFQKVGGPRGDGNRRRGILTGAFGPMALPGASPAPVFPVFSKGGRGGGGGTIGVRWGAGVGGGPGLGEFPRPKKKGEAARASGAQFRGIRP